MDTGETPPTRVETLATERPCLSPQLLQRTLGTVVKRTVESTFSKLLGPKVGKSSYKLLINGSHSLSRRQASGKASALNNYGRLWDGCPYSHLTSLSHSLIINSGESLSFSRTATLLATGSFASLRQQPRFQLSKNRFQEQVFQGLSL